MAEVSVHGGILEFVRDRQDWMINDKAAVRVVPSEYGGYDVVLRVDGSYGSLEDAEEVREYFERYWRQSVRKEASRSTREGKRK
jgi:hypothetical protein